MVDHCLGWVKHRPSGGREIHLSVAASDGLSFGVADDAHYDIEIDETPGQPTKVYGSPSAFPSLEVYMYDSDGAHLVYFYDSKAAGTNFTDLQRTIYLNHNSAHDGTKNEVLDNCWHCIGVVAYGVAH